MSIKEKLRGLARLLNATYSVEVTPDVQLGGIKLGLSNVVKDSSVLMIGFENHAYNSTITEVGADNEMQKSKGKQIAFRNKAYQSQVIQVGGRVYAENSNATQFGLISRAGKEGSYLQFGLITYRDGPWYKTLMPLLGWSPIFGFRRTYNQAKLS